MSESNKNSAKDAADSKQPVASDTKADPYNLAEVQGVTYLSYLGILLLIPLLMHQNNQFVKFHANQGLVLAIAVMVVSFALSITIILALLLPIVYIAGIVYIILGMVNVSKGEMKRLPLIGKFDIIK